MNKMNKTQKNVRIIFTDLKGCPSIEMSSNVYEKLINEFFHKNGDDSIKFDDFVYYIKHIPTSIGIVHCSAFLTWWLNNPITYKYYWPKCKMSIFTDKGYYADSVKISGLIKVESIEKDLGIPADKMSTAVAYINGDFDVRLAMRQMMNSSYGIPTSLVHIKDVIFNDPATIVFWSDGTKTVCTCSEQDTYDPEKGLALCVMKRVLYKNKGHIFNNAREKWLKKGKIKP